MYNIIGKTTNFYKLLNLKNTCSDEEIIESYSKLSSHWDPTKNKCNFARERFTDISKAYYILSEKLSRKKYDILSKNKQQLNFEFTFKDALDVYEKFLTPNIENKDINIIQQNEKYSPGIPDELINELQGLSLNMHPGISGIPMNAEIHIISMDEMDPQMNGLLGSMMGNAMNSIHNVFNNIINNDINNVNMPNNNIDMGPNITILDED